MRVLGWALIGVFGGGILFLFVIWAVQTLDGYYVGGESSTALVILVVLAVAASLPIGLGVWMINRAKRRSLHLGRGPTPG